jgi:hypothetical protein
VAVNQTDNKTRLSTSSVTGPEAVEPSPPPPKPRKGNWNQVYPSGAKFWPLDPSMDEVFIRDIAHSLSNVCRFGGHIQEFYSVAQHSTLVSEVLAPDRELELFAQGTTPLAVKSYGLLVNLGLAGLLHDAAEAYVGDMVAPLKRSVAMEPYREAEGVILEVIFRRFQLGLEFIPSGYQDSARAIKEADTRMLFTEKRDLRDPFLDGRGALWESKGTPYDQVVIRPQPPQAAREMFLNRFYDLWMRKTGESWKEDV